MASMSPLRKTALALFAMLLSLSFGGRATQAQQEGAQTLFVTAIGVPVRAYPFPQAPVLRYLHCGDRERGAPYADDTRWYVLASGGYVFSEFVSGSSPSCPPYLVMYPTRSVIALHTAPTSHSAVLRLVSCDEALVVTGRTNNEWLRVEFPARGFVITKQLAEQPLAGCAPPPVFYVVVQQARVRAAPDLSAPIVALLRCGDVVRSDGRTATGWLRLATPVRGFIAQSLISSQARDCGAW